MNLTIFGRIYRSHHNYALSLSVLACSSLGVEKTFKEIKGFSLFYLCCQAPAQESLLQGSGKFTILVDASLVRITIHLVCMDHVLD